MKTLVQELQQKLLDPQLSTLESLRLALYVAKKLKLPDFEAWVNAELNGYTDSTQIPTYRIISCQLKGLKNISGKWEPIFFEDPEKENLFSKTPIGQAIGELETLSALGKSSDGVLTIPLLKSLENQIITGLYGGGRPSEVALIVDRVQLRGIAEKVKNLLINWSLELEEAGVEGIDMNFSEEEKEAAKTISITNNYHAETQTVVHSMEHSNIAQATRGATQSFVQKNFDSTSLIKMVEEIKAEIESLSLSVNQKNEIKSDLDTLHSQAVSPNPKFSIIRESLLSLKSIFENTAGECAAALLMKVSGFMGLMSIT